MLTIFWDFLSKKVKSKENLDNLRIAKENLNANGETEQIKQTIGFLVLTGPWKSSNDQNLFPFAYSPFVFYYDEMKGSYYDKICSSDNYFQLKLFV